MTETATATRTFPVIEWFGPTHQGEGSLAGLPTYFVRFGGCDYRCDFCDSMFAVEPEQVRANAERLEAPEIIERLLALPPGPQWVTLSGGNPALLKLGPLIEALHAADLRVAVETQGSRWRDWLADVDCLTVSPKGPSSGMADKTAAQLGRFMAAAGDPIERPRNLDCLKIVVFDDADLEWARDIFAAYPSWPAFLSVGTPPIAVWGSEVTKGVSTREVREQVGDRYAWLCDRVSADPAFAQVRVLPQLHVVAYGHARGV